MAREKLTPIIIPFSRDANEDFDKMAAIDAWLITQKMDVFVDAYAIRNSGMMNVQTRGHQLYGPEGKQDGEERLRDIFALRFGLTRKGGDGGWRFHFKRRSSGVLFKLTFGGA